MKEICAGPTTIKRVAYSRDLSEFNFFNIKPDANMGEVSDELPVNGDWTKDLGITIEPCVQGLLIYVTRFGKYFDLDSSFGPVLLPWNVIEVMKVIGGYRSLYYLHPELYKRFIELRDI